jgi:hypothetical protein
MRMRTRPTVRSLIRLAAVVPVLGGLTAIGAVAHVGLPLSGCAQAATEHHAALVVEHGDGAVITVCVPFSGDSITGDQLLNYAKNVDPRHLEYDTGYSGKAVCQIDYEPADESGCLSGSNPYWEMYVSRSGGSWGYSSLGFTSQTFGDGDAEGFRFERPSDTSVPASPHGICPPPSSVTPAPTRPATPVPRKKATATAPPSVIASSTSTAIAPSATPSRAPSSNATADHAAAIASTNRSANLPTVSSGAWAAAGLGGVLLTGLVFQFARTRRRSHQRPPP